MRLKIKPLTLFRILLWTCITLLTAFIVCIIIGVTIPSLFKDKQLLLLLLFSLFALIFTVGAVVSGNLIREEKRFIAQLKIENTYMLGEPTQFYNLEAFKMRVDKLSRRRLHKKKKRFIVAMTPTALDISSNRNREKLLRDLNLKLAKFIDVLFSANQRNGFEARDNVYAFSRGVFLFCVFADDEALINKLVDTISNECFRMVNEDKVKIWVQPFFGIKIMDDEESVVSGVEDALIARDHSEHNVESFTYFKDSFRETESSASSEIARALDNNEFIPYYQPKYSLKEKKYVSSEALARWNSPDHGLVGPSKFIDEAERAGLLNAIDVRIFELAVKDLSDDIKRGRNVLPVSVNFSLYEFFSRKFINTIMDTLKKYQVPPRLLEIEITETTSQANKFLSLSVIRKLKSFGVRVLMDDFGTGYSQIDNLRQIPFDAIKIDKSITDKVLIDNKVSSICKYLVDLAHVNEMEVIVEGVESKEQVDLLRKYHVDTIQGFYYSKPLSIDEYNNLLREQQEKGEKKK